MERLASCGMRFLRRLPLQGAFRMSITPRFPNPLLCQGYQMTTSSHEKFVVPAGGTDVASSASSFLGSSTYEDFLIVAQSAYLDQKEVVDAHFQQALKRNPSYQWVLLMEGEPDYPKSALSWNCIKILTQTQIVPFTSINLLEHPALYGGALVLTGKPRPPFLFKDGVLFADHDQLLRLYTTGQLQKMGNTSTFEQNKYFKGELPIALY
ncbi:putative Monothiol glutaredoxin-S4, mitochondrial [Cardiosporidium cionae]|uniref:Monothiol glutaredoxin-S4, mitochondrial n=1 Tax=Cardiosporidium cionae TaxID=476202 RepID=A0ABQ7JEN6_9APIC|nr:putative Monothiol glutaredoxin-S4, mitochondrial [Cardiosporidium cionae]|eukprot:KAF8822470.1 putative Monothiol glutaredoxin-S4, mitochondrial [Cardiosporidium cionae]